MKRSSRKSHLYTQQAAQGAEDVSSRASRYGGERAGGERAGGERAGGERRRRRHAAVEIGMAGDSGAHRAIVRPAGGWSRVHLGPFSSSPRGERQVREPPRVTRRRVLESARPPSGEPTRDEIVGEAAMDLLPKRFADTVILHPLGRINHTSADDFKAALEPFVEACRAGRDHIVLDLSGVE